MNQVNNSQLYFKIITLIVLIVIMVIITVLMNQDSADQSATANYEEVEIIVSDSYQALPENSSLQKERDPSGNPQSNPATLEELGGPERVTNLENLLEGKEIEIGL